MGNLNYDKILLQTLTGRYKKLIVVLLVVVCLLIIELVYWFRTKSNCGISIWEIVFGRSARPNRLSLRQQIARKIIAIVVILLVMAWWAIPFYHDISNDQYIKVEALYSRSEQTSQRDLFSNGYIYIEFAENALTLQLPAGWSAEEFPEGQYWGTVWYSEESQVVLGFLPSSCN